MRWSFGFTGGPLVDGAIDIGCLYCTPEQVIAHLQSLGVLLDIDGDGETDSLTDGLLLLRWGFGASGETLVQDAVDVFNCERCTAPEIEAYLDGLDGG
jgi:hypothetical protein